MRVAFYPEARLEYREAAAYYEARRPALGAAFTLDVEAAIERILAAPDRWRCVEQDVRRCPLRVFPYGILYTVEGDFILHHCSRAWQSQARILARTIASRLTPS
jgi:hypothetical protein